MRSRVRIATLACLFVSLGLYANTARAQTFAKGADVSWVTQMEASGVRWFNDNGTQQDVLQILKDHGMNTIRLRVWVNPSGGWNGVNDVVTKAVRARNAGFRIMIDFHYSDSWADPGKQTKPAAWRTHTFDQLMADVYSHTLGVMNVALRQRHHRQSARKFAQKRHDCRFERRARPHGSVDQLDELRVGHRNVERGAERHQPRRHDERRSGKHRFDDRHG